MPFSEWKTNKNQKRQTFNCFTGFFELELHWHYWMRNRFVDLFFENAFLSTTFHCKQTWQHMRPIRLLTLSQNPFFTYIILPHFFFSIYLLCKFDLDIHLRKTVLKSIRCNWNTNNIVLFLFLSIRSVRWFDEEKKGIVFTVINLSVICLYWLNHRWL